MKPVLVATALLAAAIAGPAAAADPAAGYFPTTIVESSRPQPISFLESVYGGAPDGSFLGLGNYYVTFDLGETLLVDGAGQDLNVYEYNFVGSGSPEFFRLHVLVSADNVTFFNIDGSIGDVAPLAGVAPAGVAGSHRSFDVGGAAAALGVSGFRYIKLQGDLDGAVTDGFDLDAIGLVNFGSAVPEPATWALLIAGFGLAGAALRRRSAAAA